jgi:hypothetical protein
MRGCAYEWPGAEPSSAEAQLTVLSADAIVAQCSLPALLPAAIRSVVISSSPPPPVCRIQTAEAILKYLNGRQAPGSSLGYREYEVGGGGAAH